jgi:high-affinity Fe2+/Pb2+ permease
LGVPIGSMAGLVMGGWINDVWDWRTAFFIVGLPGLLLAAVAWFVLKLGRKLPVKRFLTVALVIVMLTSVAVLGNAMRALQEAAVIDLHFLGDWPSLPIYLAQATGYYPTLPSVVAQGLLLLVYVIGAIVTYGYAARRKAGLAAASAPGTDASASLDRPLSV